MEKINRVEKIDAKPDVNIFLNKPFVSSDKKEQHESNKGFKEELNNSIEELKNKDESFSETVSKIELTPRDIQLMELRRCKINLEQIKENEIDDKSHLM